MKRLLLTSLMLLTFSLTSCDTSGPDDGGDSPSEDGDRAVVQFEQMHV